MHEAGTASPALEAPKVETVDRLGILGRTRLLDHDSLFRQPADVVAPRRRELIVPERRIARRQGAQVRRVVLDHVTQPRQLRLVMPYRRWWLSCRAALRRI